MAQPDLSDIIGTCRCLTRNPRWHVHAGVRSIGCNAFEARTTDGHFSAVGVTRDEAADKLSAQFPSMQQVVVHIIPDPKPRPDISSFQESEP